MPNLYLYLQLFDMPNYENTFTNRMFVQEAVYFGMVHGLPFKYTFSNSKFPYSSKLNNDFTFLSENIDHIKEVTTRYNLKWTYPYINKRILHYFKPRIRAEQFAIKRFKHKFKI